MRENVAVRPGGHTSYLVGTSHRHHSPSPSIAHKCWNRNWRRRRTDHCSRRTTDDFARARAFRSRQWRAERQTEKAQLSWPFLSHHSRPSNVQSSIEFTSRRLQSFHTAILLSRAFWKCQVAKGASEATVAWIKTSKPASASASDGGVFARAQ